MKTSREKIIRNLIKGHVYEFNGERIRFKKGCFQNKYYCKDTEKWDKKWDKNLNINEYGLSSIAWKKVKK